MQSQKYLSISTQFFFFIYLRPGINFMLLIHRQNFQRATAAMKSKNTQVQNVFFILHWNVYGVLLSITSIDVALLLLLVRYNFAPFQFASITISHYIQRYLKIGRGARRDHWNRWMEEKRKTLSFYSIWSLFECTHFICVCQTFFFLLFNFCYCQFDLLVRGK